MASQVVASHNLGDTPFTYMCSNQQIGLSGLLCILRMSLVHTQAVRYYSAAVFRLSIHPVNAQL